MQLSKTENKVHETLRNAGVILFTVKEICQLLSINKTKAYNTVKALKKKKVIKKAGEYLGYIGVLEGIYAIGRFWGQYQLQKQGWDPATASATIQLGVGALFTLALPPIRYAIRQLSEK